MSSELRGRTVVRAGILAGSTAPGKAVSLRASRCGACGHLEFPALARCPVCGEAAPPVELRGPAVLTALTTVSVPVPDSLVSPPFHVGIARFSEGISVLGLVTFAGPEPARGVELEVVAFPVGDDRLTYAFRPAGTGEGTTPRSTTAQARP